MNVVKDTNPYLLPDPENMALILICNMLKTLGFYYLNFVVARMPCVAWVRGYYMTQRQMLKGSSYRETATGYFLLTRQAEDCRLLDIQDAAVVVLAKWKRK